MAKIIETDTAVNGIIDGINIVANIVKITLGPKGNNVALDRPFASPLITNDGVTIAKEIELEKPFENMGAKLIKEVCTKTNEVAGDGTTTAIVLAQGFIKELSKEINNGHSPIDLNEKIKYITNLLAEKLKESSTKITSIDEIKNIATISSGNSEIGDMIAQAKRLVGIDGIISLIESNSGKTDLMVEDGICLDTGFLSPYLCTDINKQNIEFDNAKILIFDKKFDNMQELLPLFEQAVGNNQKLLIFCDNVSDELLKTIIVNKMRGTLQIAICKIPYYGEKRSALLEDLATLTNTKYYSESKGDNMQNITLDDLGLAQNIVITKDSTTLICKCAEKEKINNQIATLKQKLEDAKPDEKDLIKIRLARLSGGVAVISVGADTELEMQEKKLRIEDALSSTNSAIEQGIIVGGGLALFRLKDYLDNLKNQYPEYEIAIKILSKVIQYPIKQIITNCGKSPDVILEKLENNNDKNFGYNAKENCFCNLLENGIIDPTKVTITALKNACSIATTILTTKGGVTDYIKQTS